MRESVTADQQLRSRCPRCRSSFRRNKASSDTIQLSTSRRALRRAIVRRRRGRLGRALGNPGRNIEACGIYVDGLPVRIDACRGLLNRSLAVTSPMPAHYERPAYNSMATAGYTHRGRIIFVWPPLPGANKGVNEQGNSDVRAGKRPASSGRCRYAATTLSRYPYSVAVAIRPVSGG
jgi:hypothetical protein